MMDIKSLKVFIGYYEGDNNVESDLSDNDWTMIKKMEKQGILERNVFSGIPYTPDGELHYKLPTTGIKMMDIILDICKF